MDKETLSNYGWIVICIMILAVLLALASPFGNFVASAIKSTTAGFFSVNQNALNAAGVPGLTIPDQEFDEPTPASKPEPVAELSEHGFYYNKIYGGRISANHGIVRAMLSLKFTMIIPGEDGNPYAVYFNYTSDGLNELAPTFCSKMTLGDNGIWEDDFGSTYRFLENGTQIEIIDGEKGFGGILTFYDNYDSCTSKYEEKYTNATTNEVYVLHENNTITITDSNGVTNTYNTKWLGRFMLSVEGYPNDIYLGLKGADAVFPQE